MSATTEPESVTLLATTDVIPAFIEQQYDDYAAESHEVWRTLYARRMPALQHTASTLFLEGAERIGLSATRVPQLTDVNQRLAARTGWAAVGVGGFLPAHEFFRCLAGRRFPTTLQVRARENLDYCPEPDIFHDVFGHVPLHADVHFAAFLQRFGAVAASARNEDETTMMARLFWFSVEFGLVREGGEVKVYGSGLISSHADSANALGLTCDRRPFTLDAVISEPFGIDHLQDVLFVVESFEQLFDAVRELAGRLHIPDPA